MSNLGLMFVPVSAGILFQLRSLGEAAWHVVWIVVVGVMMMQPVASWPVINIWFGK